LDRTTVPLKMLTIFRTAVHHVKQILPVLIYVERARC